MFPARVGVIADGDPLERGGTRGTGGDGLCDGSRPQLGLGLRETGLGWRQGPALKGVYHHQLQSLWHEIR